MSIDKNLQNKIKELEEKVYYQSQVIETSNNLIKSQKEIIEKQKIIIKNDEIIQKLDREMVLLLVGELKRIHPENKHWLNNIFKPMMKENEENGSALPVANKLLEELKEWSETRKKIFKEEEE